MSIIIHASQAFAKRYSCELSLPGEKVPQVGRLDSWSAHCVRIGRKPIAMLMNDASLWSIIIPVTGLTTLEKLLPVLLGRISEVWSAHGASFDAANQGVVFFSRSNRSLIGSMKDAISQVRFVDETDRMEGREMDWVEMETSLNRMPYSALKFDRPADRSPRCAALRGTLTRTSGDVGADGLRRRARAALGVFRGLSTNLSPSNEVRSERSLRTEAGG